MKKIEIVKKIMKEANGIVKTVDLNKVGIQNYEIVKMCENKEIKRIKQGYYHLANQNDISDEQMIAFFFEEGIICMDSALFHYGYSDRTPVVWTLAVPRSLSRSKLKLDSFSYKVYFVQDELLSLGKSEGDFNGIKLAVYDRERTICDCFKYRNKIDSELFNKAIHAYVADDKKNLVNLSIYAKKMRVYNELKKIMGVMLNE